MRIFATYMPMKHSFKYISSLTEVDARLDRKVVRDHMIEELPSTPWADIEILNWLSGDDKLPVEYSFAETFFGQVLAANTPHGICYLSLVASNPETVRMDFNKRFGHAVRVERQTFLQKQTVRFLNGDRSEHIALHLRGTPYQIEIWQRLIRIPCGKVVSYATLGGGAAHARAAGTANGKNPVCWIVPCHRVVKTDGDFDRYFWGEAMKERLLTWEICG